MAKMNFLERAKRLGHPTDEKTLREGITTTIMVKSLQELKELMNYDSLVYNDFATDESTNDASPEAALIRKIYQYVFGGEDQLASNDLDMLDKMFPIPVKATSKENKTIDNEWNIDSGEIITDNFKTVTIENGGYINVINTEYRLNVDEIIIKGEANTDHSIINILGRDGADGQNGTNGHNGFNGANGADDTVAHHGESGGNGTCATSGTSGISGTGYNSAIIEIFDHVEGELTVMAKSGKGGNGGNGGIGGNGGNGGEGGDVHVGLCNDITGSNGGNGGHGGNGGNGGQGGHGGNSQRIPIFITVPADFKDKIITKTETSTGGHGGNPGKGGKAGKGGANGCGNCHGPRGRAGTDGSEGNNGSRGNDGNPGTPGEIIVNVS